MTLAATARLFQLTNNKTRTALKRAGVTIRTGQTGLDQLQYCRHGHELAKVGMYYPRGGGSPRCKDCQKLSAAVWGAANPEKRRKAARS